MPTYIVGDIHGCGVEFVELLESIHFGNDDRMIFVGDAFDRGPAPEVVLNLPLEPNFDLVMGNHELKILAQLQYEVGELDEPPSISGTQEACLCKLEDFKDDLRTLLEISPVVIQGIDPSIQQNWAVVHAGLHPDMGLQSSAADLTTIRRVSSMPGTPFWYDVYQGKALLFFGHAHSDDVIERFANGRRLVIGLDTGCVYGNRLTAYCLDTDTFHSVKAHRF